jgi:L-gulonate 3-dehydrogenase
MKTAILGSGLIGRSWAVVFARGGHEVVLWDQDPQQPSRALEHISLTLPDMANAGLISAPEHIKDRIRVAHSLEEAVSEADVVQENILERAEPKQRLFSEVEALAPAGTILLSSTSAIMPTILFGELKTRHRCLVAHPLNPPHLAPIVELCGAPFTSPDVIERTRSFMAGCEMSPILVRREIEGFILNRLQLAVLNEAFRLISDGYVTASDLDKTMTDGLALRWSFMGPIETIDLNAPGGVADYVERYGPTIRRIGDSQSSAKPWPDDVASELNSERRASVPLERLGEATTWRDRRMMALAAHKRSQQQLK